MICFLQRIRRKPRRATELLLSVPFVRVNSKMSKTIMNHFSFLFFRCKKNEVPVEKVYNKTQREKFAWALDMAEKDFVF